MFMDRNFYLRAASASVLSIVFIVIILAGGFIFSATIMLVVALSIYEWSRMVYRGNKPSDHKRWWNTLGLLLISTAGVSILYLRYEPLGLRYVFFLVGVVCLTDIFAYLVGRKIGGIKLAPSISPNKTISGCVGGLVFASCFGFVWGLMYGKQAMVLYTIITSILAQIGDLLESAIKRKFGVKDSGALIPGHGGVLDRIDGFLLAAPFVAIFVS